MKVHREDHAMARRRQAQTTHRSAPLSGEFGLGYATRLFGEEAIASLPVITRGPNKGKPRGYVCWLRTTEAGYHVNAGRGVSADTTVRAWIGEGQYTDQDNAVRGMWLGRIQNICGSMDLLTPAYRARHAEEEARDKAEREAERAERTAKPTSLQASED
jgi:hypothetical protein